MSDQLVTNELGICNCEQNTCSSCPDTLHLIGATIVLGHHRELDGEFGVIQEDALAIHQLEWDFQAGNPITLGIGRLIAVCIQREVPAPHQKERSKKERKDMVL